MVSPHPSLYFFLQFLFQLFLMSTLVPDENSMKDLLCDSSFGSMVTLDYVNPLTSSPRSGRSGKGGCSETSISSRGFNCSICDWKYEIVPFIGVNTSFAVNLLAWISHASICSNSSMSAISMSPFQIPPACNAYPRKKT